jgi:hypothetical protein
MPVEPLAAHSFSYHLVAFDGDGRERTDDPDGKMSERTAAALRGQAVTDVFIASHGWQGDVVSARDQYSRWIGAMLGCANDRRLIRERRPGFSPLVIGFHWPSRPFGDEDLRSRRSFAEEESASTLSVDELVDEYAARLVDTPPARDALRTIVTAALAGPAPAELPAEVREAYLVLDREMALGASGPAAAPGADREPFDPDRAYKADAGGVRPTFDEQRPPGDRLLQPLRQLSFWRMKDRGRKIGETAGATLLRSLQDAGGDDVRFHLMGHSFGCIVVSAMACGAQKAAAKPKPIHSLALLQGALSLWSYCADVPGTGSAGYFRDLVTRPLVRGPIITTLSKHDTAVGRLYPVAAGAEATVRKVTFADEMPRYGALGSFGAQGKDLAVQDVAMRPASEQYGFVGGGVYNLESSTYICEGGGLAGAHSDIVRPEVAHAVWEAAATAV